MRIKKSKISRSVSAISILIAVCFFLCSFSSCFAQTTGPDSTFVYKKRVLETSEVDFLSSYYSQDGDNASVTGGIGNEKLTDFTPTVVVRVPINDDDILTVDAGISAYTSASSSNLDPFDSGKSENSSANIIGSPWVASSGASKSDTWAGATISYSHSSDSRNTIYDADASIANEYDYSSLGFGAGFTQLFNDKNTTLGINANVYLDSWHPEYPIELRGANNSLNRYYNGLIVYDENGNETALWHPVSGFSLIDNKSRNTYSLSLSLSQILTKNAQVQIILDLVKQQGWLANPMQRVYFKDIPNFYVGNPQSIPNYTSPANTDVFQLADDIERLPHNRFKVPIGIRFNYFINEIVSLRTFYRYYFDDWGVKSNTAKIEVPIKISDKFTLYPSFRYYTQTAADYFAPFDEHFSTDEFYTSDYDLSEFNATQYGFGITYTDIFTNFHLWSLGLKSIDLKASNYRRNTGLTAHIISLGINFVDVK